MSTVLTDIVNNREFTTAGGFACSERHAYVVYETKTTNPEVRDRPQLAVLFNRENWQQTDVPVMVIGCNNWKKKRNIIARTLKAFFDNIAGAKYKAEHTDAVHKVLREIQNKPEDYTENGRLLIAKIVEKLTEAESAPKRKSDLEKTQKELHAQRKRIAENVMKQTGSVGATYRVFTKQIGPASWDETYYDFLE